MQGFSPYSTTLDVTLSTTIVPGESYSFRVRAANIHGFGEFSDTVVIKAAGIADQVLTVVTSIDSVTGGVIIDWVAPHDGSESITEYLIEIANTDDETFFEDTTDCGGSDASVTTCTVPMDTLTQSPFNLAFNQLVLARVSAINTYGSSTPSTVNTIGARVRRVPDKMDAVTVSTL